VNTTGKQGAPLKRPPWFVTSPCHPIAASLVLVLFYPVLSRASILLLLWGLLAGFSWGCWWFWRYGRRILSAFDAIQAALTLAQAHRVYRLNLHVTLNGQPIVNDTLEVNRDGDIQIELQAGAPPRFGVRLRN
jgi:hypothetical protein